MAESTQYKDATPEEITALMRRLKEAPMSRLTLEKGIGASGVMIDEKTQDTYVKVTRHGETVNVARLRLEEDGSHSVKMLSGKTSQFGVTVCGAKSKSVVLCVDWCDAWHINLLTGQQAVCCWTMENMTDLAEKFADHAARGVLFIASNGGFDELSDIERANTLATVIIPDDGQESIFKARKFRRVANLSEWLDEMKREGMGAKQ